MSWERVRTLRDRLRAQGPQTPCGLSPEGARLVWNIALDALDDETLERVSRIEGEPFEAACVITASTVPTASFEWAAVLLGRGTRVFLRPSSRQPGWTDQLVRAAGELDLPLEVGEALDAPLVVAMGSDATIDTLRSRVGGRLLGFGHRISFAVTDSELDAVAADHACHDSRGCMSPVALLTSLSLEDACDRLALALERAHARWPTGSLAPAEHAAIRERRALARVVGTVREGPGWSVHGLPQAHFRPLALPRSLAVVQVRDPAAFLAKQGPLSTLGTRLPLSFEGCRRCPPGQMQRPPVERLHDGVDWLRETLRAPS